MLNSMGWIFIIISLISVIVKGQPGILIIGLFGAGMIWLQLRGKRITVDTTKKVIKSGGKTHAIKSPHRIFMKEVKMSQTVNARVNSTNVRMYFYKAYLHDGKETILLSSNRKEDRDLEKLQAIALDLNIPLEKTY